MYKVASGKERLGSGDFMDNAAVSVLVASILGVILVVLLILFVAKKYSEPLRKLYEMIKKKIVWNAFIRYVLQESLKLQITATTIILLATSTGSKYDHLEKDRSEIGRMLEDNDSIDKPWTISEVISPILLLIGINAVPLLFIFVMYYYRETLKEVKTRDTIGSLYQTI